MTTFPTHSIFFRNTANVDIKLTDVTPQDLINSASISNPGVDVVDFSSGFNNLRDYGGVIFRAAGSPAANLGSESDLYLDETSGSIYGPKTATGWGTPFVAGVGSGAGALLSGTGVPAGGLGSDGDFYIDTATNELYGPKTGGAWGSGILLGGGGGSTTLTGLTDTDINAPSVGQFLTYDGSNWVNDNKLTVETDGTLVVNTTDYETLVTTDDIIPNKKYVDDKIASEITAAPADSTKITKGGDTDAAPLVIGTNDAFQVQIETGGITQFTVGTTGTLTANATDYETLVTTDDIIPNKKYVDDKIASEITAAPADSTKITKGGDTDAAPLVIGTNDVQPVQIETGGITQFTVGTTGTLTANATDYETLVTTDDIIPNKKYVDDLVSQLNLSPILEYETFGPQFTEVLGEKSGSKCGKNYWTLDSAYNSALYTNGYKNSNSPSEQSMTFINVETGRRIFLKAENTGANEPNGLATPSVPGSGFSVTDLTTNFGYVQVRYSVWENEALTEELFGSGQRDSFFLGLDELFFQITFVIQPKIAIRIEAESMLSFTPVVGTTFNYGASINGAFNIPGSSIVFSNQETSVDGVIRTMFSLKKGLNSFLMNTYATTQTGSVDVIFDDTASWYPEMFQLKSRFSTAFGTSADMVYTVDSTNGCAFKNITTYDGSGNASTDLSLFTQDQVDNRFIWGEILNASTSRVFKTTITTSSTVPNVTPKPYTFEYGIGHGNCETFPHTINSHYDVDVSTIPVNGSALVYNSATGKWVDSAVSIDGSKVTKGGDTDAADVVIGTNDAFQVQIETGGITQFTVGTTGTLTANATDYETLVTTDDIIPNKKYVDDKIASEITAAPADSTKITKGGDTDAADVVIGTNDAFQVQIETGGITQFTVGTTGTLTANATDYETLVTTDDIIPNKKYVDDKIASEITAAPADSTKITKGGDTDAAPLVIGTNDAFQVQIETGGITQFTVGTTGTLTANATDYETLVTTDDIIPNKKYVDDKIASEITAAPADSTKITKGGDTDAADVVIGTNDAFQVQIETGGITQFTVGTTGTLTANATDYETLVTTDDIIPNKKYVDDKIASEITAAPADSTKITKGGDTDAADVVIGTNDAFQVQIETGGITQFTVGTTGTLTANATDYETLVTTDDIIPNKKYVDDKIASEITAAPADSTKITKGGDTDAAPLVIGTNDVQPVQIETGGITQFTVGTTGTLTANATDYETLVTTDDIIPNKKYVDDKIASEITAAPADSTKITKGGDTDAADVVIGTNDAFQVQIETGGITQFTVGTTGTLTANATDYETLVTTDDIIPNKKYVDDKIASEITAAPADSTKITKGGDTDAAPLVIGTNDVQPVQIETGGITQFTVGTTGTLTANATDYETLVTTDDIIPNKKYVDDKIASEITAAPADSTKITKGGDTDAAPLVIGTNDAFQVQIETGGITQFTVGTTGTLTANATDYETLVTTDDIIPNKKYVDDKIASEITAAPADSTKITKGGDTDAADVVIGTNDAFQVQIETGGITQFTVGTTGTLTANATDYETLVTTDDIIPNKKYVDDKIASEITAAPADSTKITKGGDTDAAPLVIGTNDAFQVQIETGGITQFTVGTTGTLTANATDYETLVTTDDIIPNKKYVDDKIASEITAAPADSTKITKGGDTDAADVVIGTNDAFQVQIETGGITQFTVGTTGTLTANATDYETLVTTDDIIPNKKYVDDKIASEITAAPADSTKITKGGDTDAADVVIGTNDAFQVQIETGGITQFTVGTTGTLTANATDYETLVTTDDIIPNKKYVDDKIASEITAAPADSTKITKGGDTDAAPLVIGTNDVQPVQIETGGITQFTVGTTGTLTANATDYETLVTTDDIIPNKKYVDDKIASEITAAPADSTKITKGGDTDAADVVIGTNDAFQVQIETGGITQFTVGTTGTLTANATDYETLVTTDDIIPNKKYVDDKIASEITAAPADSTKITKGGDTDAAPLVIGTNDVQPVQIETGGITQFTVGTTGTLTANATDYETLVTTDDIIPNKKYVDDKIASEITAAPADSTKITKGGDTDAAPLVIGTNDVQPVQIETGGITQFTVGTTGTLTANATDYETLVTTDDIIPNKKYVDDKIASEITAAPADSTKITKGGDTDAAPLVIGTNDVQPVQIETGGITQFTVGTTGTLTANATDYETLVTTDDIIPNKKYVDDKIASEITAAPADSTKITKGGDTDAAPLVIGTNDVQPVQIETGGITQFTVGTTGTLTANATDYETLVTTDDIIPNKKYVDSVAGSTSSYGAIYWTGNTTKENGGSNITTNQNIKLNGPGSNTTLYLKNFTSPSVNRLTYTGAATIITEVNYNCSMNTGDNDRSFKYSIRKNGVVNSVPQSRSLGVSQNNIAGADGVSCTFLMQLATNDYIEIWAENIANSTELTILEYQLMAKIIDLV